MKAATQRFDLKQILMNPFGTDEQDDEKNLLDNSDSESEDKHDEHDDDFLKKNEFRLGKVKNY